MVSMLYCKKIRLLLTKIMVSTTILFSPTMLTFDRIDLVYYETGVQWRAALLLTGEAVGETNQALFFIPRGEQAGRFWHVTNSQDFALQAGLRTTIYVNIPNPPDNTLSTIPMVIVMYGSIAEELSFNDMDALLLLLASASSPNPLQLANLYLWIIETSNLRIMEISNLRQRLLPFEQSQQLHQRLNQLEETYQQLLERTRVTSSQPDCSNPSSE